jgi:hypothetical protein
MATWHLAPSLAVLRAEVNARWPGRDRTSDGSIGDTAHSSRSSDHNPNSRRSVNAIDVDEDGVDMAAIKAAIQRHPSAHYWIYERRIADRDNDWRPVPYYGDNPHDKHLHVSIRQTTSAEQDRRPWGLLAGEDDDMSAEDVVQGLYLALTQAAKPDAGDAGKRGRHTRDALRAVVGIESTNAPELEAALAPLVARLAALEARPPVQAGPVDTAALMAALEPALRAAAVAGAAEAIQQVLRDAVDDAPGT